MSGIKKLVLEIHRRSLWQVLAIYIGGAWACYEIIDTVTDRLALPRWLPVIAIFFFLLGLPFVLATAFVREREGVEVSGGDSRAAAQPPPEGTAEARAAREEEMARRRVITWRNLGLAFLVALAGWGAVAAGWLIFGSHTADGESEPASVAVSALRVAVLPFSVRGSDEITYLGDGMVDLLSTALDGAGDLRVVDPYALMKFLGHVREAIDPGTGEAVANQFGAGLFVLGSIVEAGGRLQVNASLYSADGRLETSAEEIAEDEAQVFGLVNKLARQLLAAGMGGPNARLNQVAASTTNSLPALKAYLEGESKYRAARFSDAAAAFQRAIEADSSFALAWYRLAIASLIASQPMAVSPGHAAAQAVRFSDRLSQRDRDRLAILESFFSGDASEGERRARAILSLYPEDMEAWYYLGEFLFHYGARRGRSVDEAGAAFARALEYDPDNFAGLMHLSWVRSIQYRYAELETIAERMAELESGSEFPQFSRQLLAFLRGGQTAVSDLVDELANEPAGSIQWGSFRLALLDEGLASAAEIAGVLTDPSRPTSHRNRGYAVQANVEMARGHVRASAGVFDRWENLGLKTRFETPLEKRAAIWANAFIPAEQSELERLQEELANLDYDTIYAPVTRAYLIGLLDARLGDRADALRNANELDRFSGTDTTAAGPLAAYYATVLRAQLALDEGDHRGALRLLDATEPDDWWALRPWSLLLSQAPERYIRAQALEALGRYQEALVWYASFGWVSAEEMFYVAPTLFRRAEIYERLGDTEQAALHYRRFITRWRDCDPELRPAVAGAEEALARIEASIP